MDVSGSLVLGFRVEPGDFYGVRTGTVTVTGCPNIGHPVGDGAAFCSRCGAKTGPVQKPVHDVVLLEAAERWLQGTKVDLPDNNDPESVGEAFEALTLQCDDEVLGKVELRSVKFFRAEALQSSEDDRSESSWVLGVRLWEGKLHGNYARSPGGVSLPDPALLQGLRDLATTLGIEDPDIRLYPSLHVSI